jgi:uncharacterized protein
MKKRRILLITLLAFFGMMWTLSFTIKNDSMQTEKANIAILAKVIGSGQDAASLEILNDGRTPNTVPDEFRKYTGSANFQRRPRRLSSQWIQYNWDQPVTTDEISVFFYNFDNLVKLPQAYRIKYWDGESFVQVTDSKGSGLVNNQFNSTTFNEVTTTRLRLEIDSVERFMSPVLEWKVLKTAS